MNYIIAEAGSNHNGNKENAKKLINIAKDAGASSVKFQFIFPEGLYLPKSLVNGNLLPSKVFDVRKREELSKSDWIDVWSYSKSKGLDISASVFCFEGVKLLSELGASYVKIASTDLTNLTLIDAVCQNFKTVIISSGMATLSEVADTVTFVKNKYPKVNLKLMHCVSVYPCPLAKAQLDRIIALKNTFDIEVGYSDHTSDDISAVLAWGMGTRLFEKHFTYDQDAPGFDHAHAQTPPDLKRYINILRDCEKACLWDRFAVDDAQNITKERARRGIYAARDLPAGHVITSEDVMFVRPSTKSPFRDVSDVVGLKLEVSVKQFEAIGRLDKATTDDSNWSKAQAYWSDEMKSKKMD